MGWLKWPPPSSILECRPVHNHSYLVSFKEQSSLWITPGNSCFSSSSCMWRQSPVSLPFLQEQTGSPIVFTPNFCSEIPRSAMWSSQACGRNSGSNRLALQHHRMSEEYCQRKSLSAGNCCLAAVYAQQESKGLKPAMYQAGSFLRTDLPGGCPAGKQKTWGMRNWEHSRELPFKIPRCYLSSIDEMRNIE